MKKTLTSILAALALALPAVAGEVEFASVPMFSGSVMASNVNTLTNIPFRLNPSGDKTLGIQTVAIATNAQTSNYWFGLEFSLDGTAYSTAKTFVTNAFTGTTTNVLLNMVTVPTHARWVRFSGGLTNQLSSISNTASLTITFGQHRTQ